MPRKLAPAACRDLVTLFGAGTVGALDDGELLRRSSSGSGAAAEAAFRALVDRHGPMVMGVCRRLLSDPHDAEDAFQVTFLVLIRKARSIARPELLAGWLHGVANRTARVARERRARRRARERILADVHPTRKTPDEAQADWPAIVEEELARLPERYRLPVVLCELDGQTRREAAERLGVPEGTLSSRLSRARSLLRDRLARRGLALGAGTVAAPLARDAAASTLRPALTGSTVEAALRYAAGGAAPPSVAALTNEVLITMLLSKLKVGALAVVACAMLTAVGVSVAARYGPDDAPKTQEGRTIARNGAGSPVVAGQIVTRGRVLDPGGHAVPGAEITLWRYAIVPREWHHDDFATATPMVLATSRPDGSFRGSFPKSVMANSFATTQVDEPWTWAAVVAAAPGFGPAWTDVKPGGEPFDLRLVPDDVPVRGRVVDQEGLPVAGAKISVALLQDAKKRILFQPRWKGLSEGVTTDRDGRFELRGVGRDREVSLHVNGPSIEHKVVTVFTRPPAADAASGRDGIEVIAGPSKPVEGRVVAADTGKPLAGVWVYGGHFGGEVAGPDSMRGIRATTDADGRFRLDGMPKGQTHQIALFPRSDQPYMMEELNVADTPGLEPVRTEARLLRGVPVRCRLMDKSSGRAVHGLVSYVPYDENPQFSYHLGNLLSRHTYPADEQGYYHLLALPGAGMIKATVQKNQRGYAPARVSEADEARYPLLKGRNAFVHFHVRSFCHGYRMVNPKVGDRELAFDLDLEPAKAGPNREGERPN